MYVRVFAAAAAVFSLGAGSASAAIMLQAPNDLLCKGDSCFGVDKTVTSGALPVTISSFTFNRSMLGSLNGQVVHVTFWTGDGATQLGDFGNVALSVVKGDEVVVSGQGFTFDPTSGGLMFRIDKVDGAAGGGGGGGGGGSFGGSLGVTPPGLSSGGGPIFGNVSGDVTTSINLEAPVVGAVPEPATWALALAGFAGLGTALRRRRAKLQADAASA